MQTIFVMIINLCLSCRPNTITFDDMTVKVRQQLHFWPTFIVSHISGNGPVLQSQVMGTLYRVDSQRVRISVHIDTKSLD